MISPFNAKGQSIGLVLSGGGAKGVAHIGLIQALEDNGIPIDTFIYTWCRMVFTIDSGNAGVGKVKWNIGNLTTCKVSVVFVAPNFRANYFTLAATCAVFLNYVSGVFCDFYFKIIA